MGLNILFTWLAHSSAAWALNFIWPINNMCQAGGSKRQGAYVMARQVGVHRPRERLAITGSP